MLSPATKSVVTCCSRRTHPSDTLPFLSSLASLRTALSTVGFQRKGTGSLNYRRQPRSLPCAGTLAVQGRGAELRVSRCDRTRRDHSHVASSWHPDSEGPHVPVASQSPHQLLPCHRPFILIFLPFLTCAFLLREGKSPGSVRTLHFLQARKLRAAGQRRPSRPTSPAPCWRVAGPVAGDPHCRPILSTSSSLSLLIFDPGHVLHFIMHLS